MKIIAVGDIMPGGVLSLTNNEYASLEIRERLSKGDLRVGNFECAIEVPNPTGKKVIGKGNTIFVREKDVARVKELGIDIVSIANNHLFDLGPEGAFKAIEVLDRLGIKHCGAGHNLDEARTPVVIVKEGHSYAFFAFSDTRLQYMYEATDTEPGVNPLREDYVIDEIKAASKLYDYVIVMPHWGKENTYFPTLEVELLAKKMIKAGACLVLGGHTHRIQPVLNIRHKSIVYSMGNFLFANRIINTPRYAWYPDSMIDVNSLPQTLGCPLVERPTIKLWRPWGYIGMIVDSEIFANKVHSRYILTYTNMENCVGVLKKGVNKERFILTLLAVAIQLGIYDDVYHLAFYYKKIKKHYKKIKKHLLK